MINNDRVLKLQCPDGKCKIVRVYKDRIVGSPDETYMDMLRIQDIDNDVETSADEFEYQPIKCIKELGKTIKTFKKSDLVNKMKVKTRSKSRKRKQKNK